MRASVVLGLMAVVSCSRQPGAGDDRPSPPGPGRFVDGGDPVPRLPSRIAIADDGSIYVSDARGGRVLGYAGGEKVLELAGFEEPLGVAVHGALLLVGDGRRGTVETYDLDRKEAGLSLGAGPGEFVMPNAIAVLPDGSAVYVADSRANEVRVFGLDGSAIGRFGGKGSGPGQFRFPSAVAVDAKRVAVADQGNHRVQIFDLDGVWKSSFGEELKTPVLTLDAFRGRFTRPQGVALSGGRVWVLDSYQGHVQAFDDAGASVGFIGSRGDCATCLALALDVAADKAGNLVVLDGARRRWVVLSPEPRERP